MAHFKIIPLSVLILFIITSCSKNKTINKSNESIINYLKNPKSIVHEHYIDSFQFHYNKSLKHNDLNHAVALIEAYAIALDLTYQPDSLFVQTSEKFLKENEKYLTNYQKRVLHYYLGSQYDFFREIEKSDFYLKKTRIPADDEKERKLRAFGGMLIADHLKQSGKYHEAMTQTLENIADFEKLNDTLNVAITYSNLSNIYKNLKAYSESENYLKKSLELSITIKDTFNIWTAYVNLSRPNALEINPKKSLLYAKKAKKINQEWSASTNYHKSYTYATYAKALLLNKKYDSIGYYISQAEKYVTPQSRIKFDLLNIQAELDLLKGNELRNKELFEKEYFQAKKNNDIPVVEMLATILSDDAKAKKDYKKAYELIIEKYAIRDSAWMNDTKSNLIYLDKKFQLEKKEKLIAQQQLKITQTKSLVYLIIATILILILLLIIISIRKKRKRIIIEAQKQEQFTFQLLQNTEEERGRIAGELHDSVNHDLLAIKNNLINGKQIDVEEVANVIEEVRNISRNLHPAVLENIGLEASIENLCERLTEIGLFTTCEIAYNQKLNKNKELQLYRIIQEALNNTLKHGKADAAKVILRSKEDYLLLEVKDNGTGFNVEQELKNPKSFGLQSILQRAKAITAKININSTNKGTIILINIPV